MHAAPRRGGSGRCNPGADDALDGFARAVPCRGSPPPRLVVARSRVPPRRGCSVAVCLYEAWRLARPLFTPPCRLRPGLAAQGGRCSVAPLAGASQQPPLAHQVACRRTRGRLALVTHEAHCHRWERRGGFAVPHTRGVCADPWNRPRPVALSGAIARDARPRRTRASEQGACSVGTARSGALALPGRGACLLARVLWISMGGPPRRLHRACVACTRWGRLCRGGIGAPPGVCRGATATGPPRKWAAGAFGPPGSQWFAPH